MLVKVCGITQQAQALELQQFGVDLIGAIFYEKSPRCVTESFRAEKKVGVFVNHSISQIEAFAKSHELDYLQLHGNESPDFCNHFREKGYQIIKAIAVSHELNSNYLNYSSSADMVLFDTASKGHGGTGKKFDWTIFHEQIITIPFILSGGIAANDVDQIKEIRSKQPNMIGIDINSRFELSPGVKDIELIKNFIQKIRHHD